MMRVGMGIGGRHGWERYGLCDPSVTSTCSFVSYPGVAYRATHHNTASTRLVQITRVRIISQARQSSRYTTIDHGRKIPKTSKHYQ